MRDLKKELSAALTGEDDTFQAATDVKMRLDAAELTLREHKTSREVLREGEAAFEKKMTAMDKDVQAARKNRRLNNWMLHIQPSLLGPQGLASIVPSKQFDSGG